MSIKNRIVLLILVVGATVTTPGVSDAGSAGRVQLARDGKPCATIVVSAETNVFNGDRITLAAEEIRSYVKKICGVELPVRADGKKVTGTALYVGRCEPTVGTDLPPADGNQESYSVRARNGDIYLAGRWPTSVYYAATSFLEEECGVRWFAPGDLWEWIPSGKPGNLAVTVRDRTKTPDISPRLWYGHRPADSWQRWNLRNRMVEVETTPMTQMRFFGCFFEILPPSRYAAAHPEYYPVINGERWIPPNDKNNSWEPCLSNPDVIGITVEAARRWFDKQREYRKNGVHYMNSFGLGLDDTEFHCGCPYCRALDASPGSYGRGEMSDRHCKFVNAVAREVAITHPEFYVGTLLYYHHRRPPETVDRLEDNVFGFLTENCAEWWDTRPYEPENPGRGNRELDQALTAAWAAKLKHLSRYDYFGLGSITPRVYPHYMAEQIRSDRSMGMEGRYLEAVTFLPNTAPMVWAHARLMWNTAGDVDKLLDEFYLKMFGEASSVMKEYYGLLERSWQTPRPERCKRYTWAFVNLSGQASAISTADLEEGFRLLEKADRKTRDEKVRARIDIVRTGLQYGSYLIHAFDLNRKVGETRITDRKSADRLIDDCLKGIARVSERERFWKEAERRSDVLGDIARTWAKEACVQEPLGNLRWYDPAAGIGIIKALSWYEENDPSRLESLMSTCCAAAPGDPAETIRAWYQSKQGRPENLLVNGDFSAGTSVNASPETGKGGSDWSGRNTPLGWLTWPVREGAKFKLLTEQTGNVSAAISTVTGGGATYIQETKAAPDQTYLLTGRVRILPGPKGIMGGDCLPFVAVRFMTAQHHWFAGEGAQPKVNLAVCTDQWQDVYIRFVVPKGVGLILTQLGAYGQYNEEWILFDDFRLYRIP